MINIIEYKHFVFKNTDSFDKINLLGLEGWDLVTVIAAPNGNLLYIFKRPLK